MAGLGAAHPFPSFHSSHTWSNWTSMLGKTDESASRSSWLGAWPKQMSSNCGSGPGTRLRPWLSAYFSTAASIASAGSRAELMRLVHVPHNPSSMCLEGGSTCLQQMP